VEKAKKTWLDGRGRGGADESAIGGMLISRERWGRTLLWDANWKPPWPR